MNSELTAIVGMACRFPGANDYNQFWQNLEKGVNSISEIPARRWEVQKYYSPNPEVQNKTISKWGGLIEGIDMFDAQLFGISPREATRMDPQQRIMLELSWSCLEDAGYSPLELSGRQVGVFIGSCNYDYNELQHQDENNIEGHTATGTYTCIIPNRISYFFNWHGPSVPVDTACSSSLVALHQAINAIEKEECEMALVGGISVLCTPTSYISFSQLGMLSPKGQCKTFDSDADGYVRGEGAGIVFLKPLRKALSDKDRIYGVIKGSAVNHGGKARTLTSPNIYAQAQVLRAAYTKANISPDTVTYIETHGTGTPLGDPIEINGLKRSFRQLHQPQAKKPYCGLGAVKTNIGHTEAAAGIAGVIKMLLAIKHRKLPAIVNFKQLNPRIELEGSPFYIVRETQEWEQLQTEAGEAIPRRAGVSSFGFGGVNAHVVLEEPPEWKTMKGEIERPLHLLKLSAQTEEVLGELATKYAKYLQSDADAALQDICFSANKGRTDFAERLVVVAGSRDELHKGLSNFLKGDETNGLCLPFCASSDPKRHSVAKGLAENRPIAFLFTGQGSQYLQMGRQLYETQPTFRKNIDRCNQILSLYLEVPLLDVLYPDNSQIEGVLENKESALSQQQLLQLIDETAYTQPALFAMEYALAKLWESWGIKPKVVMGHSVGEYVAACIAGVFSLEDGLKLIATRGKLMQQLPSGGVMVSLMASEERVKEAIAPYAEQVAMAAINGPESIVISGESEAVNEIVSSLEAKGIKSKQLQVSHAFHSPMMEPMLASFEAAAKEVTYSKPIIALISNVSGCQVGDEITSAAYWTGHVRQPVRFAQSMKTLEALGYELFLEIGPKPILLGMGRQCLSEDRGVWLPSLRPGKEDWQQMFESLGEMYVRGAKVDWQGFDRDYPQRRKVTLPTYPFIRQRYWIDAPLKRLQSSQQLHPLLGVKTELADEELLYSQTFVPHDGWLADHQVYEKIVMPGAGFASMALASQSRPTRLREVVFERPMILTGPCELQLRIQQTEADEQRFMIYSRSGDKAAWQLHSYGLLGSAPNREAYLDIDDLQSRLQPREVDQMYSRLGTLGLKLGPTFRSIEHLWGGQSEALAEIVLPDALANAEPVKPIHPAILDACTQISIGAVEEIMHIMHDDLYLPLQYRQIDIHRDAPSRLFCYARAIEVNAAAQTVTLDLTFTDSQGVEFGGIAGFVVKRAARDAMLRELSFERLLYGMRWQETSAKTPRSESKADQTWLLLGDMTATVPLSQQLEAQGQHVFTGEPQEVKALLDTLSARESLSSRSQTESPAGSALAGVVLVSAVNSSDLATDTTCNAQAALQVVQTLIESGVHPPRGLTLVTQGALAIEAAEDVVPAQSALWGLGRTLQSEQPQLGLRLIDVELMSGGALSEALLSETSEQLALRDNQLFTPRLIRTRLESTSQSPVFIRPEASYLIAGGLGALGLKACTWLVEQGAKHVVLSSRREPDKSTQHQIAGLEKEYNCQVVWESADVTDAEQVNKLIERFGRDWPEIAGVIHAAGVLDDGTIIEQTTERFAKVLSPKVRGALNLHHATSERSLDLFVLYSSIAAVLGSAGQSNYAMANAFLDGLAQHRRANGLRATSINWGPWAEVGMAANATVRANLERQGLTPLDSREAHGAMSPIIATGTAQAVVLDADWSRMSQYLGVVRPALLWDLLTKPALQGDSDLLHQLRGAPSTERPSLLVKYMQRELQQVLGLAQPPDTDIGFFDLGMDSLMAVELRNRLQQQLGDTYRVSNTLAFDYPTVSKLAEHLAEKLGALPQAKPKGTTIVRRHLDSDAVAIVGMACRFPGAFDKEAYWALLSNGVDAITEVPTTRWDINAYYDPDPEVPGKMTTRYGGFIEGIDQFDAAFFGIAPREAVELDPQQRLLLEVGWQALEDANIAPATLVGSRTGVYVGISTNDYSQLITRGGEQAIGQYMGTGTAHSAAVGRISYVLGLEGPSMAIDTACSSSLVALHQASRSLLKGDCDVALVGGVNALLTPEMTIYFSRGGFMAPDGRCKSFDAAANGYVRGEGCGMVVLKRLSDAERDSDRIYAVLRGSSVNQDGASGGLTVPNGPSQERVISEALAQAGIAPSKVAYIEAHGTGTPLGDPIELQALQNVLGTERDGDRPLLVGSVKTNIGHLEAAAGMASVIKVVLSMQNDQIPSQLHFQKPSPKIPWDDINIKVAAEPQSWPSGRKIAGVSGFAFQGTNAHVVLEAYSPQLAMAPNPGISSAAEAALTEPKIHLLTFSSKTEQALRELASRYVGWLDQHPETNLANMCFTARVGRNHFEHRSFVVVSTRDRLREVLQQQAAGQILVGRYQQQPKVALLFTGQGSQYVGMGRELYQTQPTFRKALDRCAEILNSYLDIPLESLLYPKEGEDSLLDQTSYTQPALFALEYALYQLWRSWGIRPSAVMGHSVGEYVAACIAGVFSLEDGLKLIATRGKLMQQLPSGGVMVSLMASEERVKEAIAPYAEQVAIAAINGPKSIVISGESEAVNEIVSSLEAKGIKSKQLQVSHAFHSPMMEPMLAEFEAAAKEVTYSKPIIALISNVSGCQVGDEITSAAYWTGHVRQPVRFAESMKTLEALGYELFLEIGPKPILLGMGRQCLASDTGVWLPSLRPEKEDWQQMLESLGQLYVRGVQVDWSGFDRDYGGRKVVLPTYPFQRERYWIENLNKYQKKRYLSKKLHPMLGERLNCAGEQQIFESYLEEKELSNLRDHKVFNKALLPATAYLEIAAAASQNRFKTPRVVIEDLVIGRGLIWSPGERFSVQTILTPLEKETYKWQIFSQESRESEDGEEWRLHATGKIKPLQTETSNENVEIEKFWADCNREIEVKQHYQKCREIGIDYGSSFQGVKSLRAGANLAVAMIKLPEGLEEDAGVYQFHPVLLDAAFQITYHILPETNNEKTYLPVGMDKLEIHARPGVEVWAIASLTAPEGKSTENITVQVTLASPEGEIVALVEGLRVKQATPQTLLGTEGESITDWLYEVEWRAKGRLGRLLPTSNILEPVEIEQQLSQSLTELVATVDQKSSSQSAASLEELSREYIVQALLELGWPYLVGDRFTTEAASQRLGIVPSHRRLFKRMLEIIASEGMVRSDQQEWQVLQTLDPVNPLEKIQTSISQYPDAVAELTLLKRCASQLSEVLRGTQDPVQLVFPSGDLTIATQLYQDTPTAKVMNTIVQQAIAKAIEKVPQQRGIRLLEIGAGTGGTTSYILPHLNPDQTEYTFTDIEKRFTSKGQEKFREYPFLRYEALDIEVDPTTQGFEAHQYDVIIAANVLHATSSMKQTLTNVRKMLAPGGLLVLWEVTSRQRWRDLVFGLLEGWWKFQDSELRPDYPLLSRTTWKQLLSEMGFTQVVTMPERSGMPEILSQQTVIVAQGSKTRLEKTASSQSVWLLLADKQGIGQKLASQLRSVGEACTLVFTGEQYQQIGAEEFTINPDNPEEMEQVVETLAAKNQSLYGVVQCWTMKTGVGEKINSQELANLSKQGCGTTLFLVQALVKRGWSQPPRLWLATSGSQAVPGEGLVMGVSQSSVWGMGKAIALEHPELNCTQVDLDPNQTIEQQADVLFQEIWSSDIEDQVVLRRDSRYVPRLVASHHRQATPQQLKIPLQPFRLAMSERGSLDNLTLKPTTRRAPAAGEVEIRVKATGLNFLDVVAALGLVPDEVDGVSQQHLVEMEGFGMECAGDIVAVGEGVKDFEIGDSVMAMAAGSFSQYVTINVTYIVRKPENISFSSAASIPANFLTAYYALHHVASMKAGDRVLIHAAAGGTGMAAVQIAQNAGAEVFATASPPKWEALRQMGVKHIMNSRTLEFADRIKEITGGEGVNIVLNSLTSGEFIPKSLEVVSSQGRFVEIAKRGVWDSSQMAAVRPDVSYFVVDLVGKSREQPELMQSMLQELVDRFSIGLLQSPPLKLFPIESVVRAFRYMQQAKHIGKIVVTQTADSDDGTEKPLSFRSDATYLITGGMGGLGLLVSRWMVERGAKHLVLVGRSSPGAEVREKITSLEKAGALVVVEKADVSDVGSLTRVMQNIEQSGIPLAGVMHGAGMLLDGVLNNQSWQSFAKVMAPKVQGGWHLHKLTQNLSLDFFVMFSSVASLLGSAGQANYSAANGFLDGLAHYRRSMGLPGLSIHWGPISQIGVAAKRGADVKLQQQGMAAIAPEKVLESLELLMKGASAEVGVVPIDWSAWQERVAKSPFLADWQEKTRKTNLETDKPEFQLEWEEAAPKERRGLLVEQVRSQVAQVLGISNPESISLTRGFFDLGMDSLTSVELRNKLQATVDCAVPSTLAFDYPTIDKLVDYLMQELEVEQEQISDESMLGKSSVEEAEVEEIAKMLAEQLGTNWE